MADIKFQRVGHLSSFTALASEGRLSDDTVYFIEDAGMISVRGKYYDGASFGKITGNPSDNEKLQAALDNLVSKINLSIDYEWAVKVKFNDQGQIIEWKDSIDIDEVDGVNEKIVELILGDSDIQNAIQAKIDNKEDKSLKQSLDGIAADADAPYPTVDSVNAALNTKVSKQPISPVEGTNFYKVVMGVDGLVKGGQEWITEEDITGSISTSKINNLDGAIHEKLLDDLTNNESVKAQVLLDVSSKEDWANKEDLDGNKAPQNAAYPTVKSVKDALDTKLNKAANITPNTTGASLVTYDETGLVTSGGLATGDHINVTIPVGTATSDLPSTDQQSLTAALSHIRRNLDRIFTTYVTKLPISPAGNYYSVTVNEDGQVIGGKLDIVWDELSDKPFNDIDGDNSLLAITTNSVGNSVLTTKFTDAEFRALQSGKASLPANTNGVFVLVDGEFEPVDQKITWSNIAEKPITSIATDKSLLTIVDGVLDTKYDVDFIDSVLADIDSRIKMPEDSSGVLILKDGSWKTITGNVDWSDINNKLITKVDVDYNSSLLSLTDGFLSTTVSKKDIDDLSNNKLDKSGRSVENGPQVLLGDEWVSIHGNVDWSDINNKLITEVKDNATYDSLLKLTNGVLDTVITKSDFDNKLSKTGVVDKEQVLLNDSFVPLFDVDYLAHSDYVDTGLSNAILDSKKYTDEAIEAAQLGTLKFIGYVGSELPGTVAPVTGQLWYQSDVTEMPGSLNPHKIYDGTNWVDDTDNYGPGLWDTWINLNAATAKSYYWLVDGWHLLDMNSQMDNNTIRPNPDTMKYEVAAYVPTIGTTYSGFLSESINFHDFWNKSVTNITYLYDNKLDKSFISGLSDNVLFGFKNGSWVPVSGNINWTDIANKAFDTVDLDNGTLIVEGNELKTTFSIKRIESLENGKLDKSNKPAEYGPQILLGDQWIPVTGNINWSDISDKLITAVDIADNSSLSLSDGLLSSKISMSAFNNKVDMPSDITSDSFYGMVRGEWTAFDGVVDWSSINNKPFTSVDTTEDNPFYIEDNGELNSKIKVSDITGLRDSKVNKSGHLDGKFYGLVNDIWTVFDINKYMPFTMVDTADDSLLRIVDSGVLKLSITKSDYDRKLYKSGVSDNKFYGLVNDTWTALDIDSFGVIRNIDTKGILTLDGDTLGTTISLSDINNKESVGRKTDLNGNIQAAEDNYPTVAAVNSGLATKVNKSSVVNEIINSPEYISTSGAVYTALAAKQDNALVTNFAGADDSHYPSTKAVKDILDTKVNKNAIANGVVVTDVAITPNASSVNKSTTLDVTIDNGSIWGSEVEDKNFKFRSDGTIQFWSDEAGIIDVSVNQSVLENTQSDWSTADSTDPSFIKNKPNVEIIENKVTTLETENINAYPTVSAVVAALATKVTKEVKSSGGILESGSGLSDYNLTEELRSRILADVNWEDVKEKPFESIGNSLSVVDGMLEVIVPHKQANWTMIDIKDPSYISNKPFDVLDLNLFSLSGNDVGQIVLGIKQNSIIYDWDNPANSLIKIENRPDVSSYQLISNLVTEWSSDSGSDILYPSEKLVKSAVDSKVNLATFTDSNGIVVTDITSSATGTGITVSKANVNTDSVVDSFTFNIASDSGSAIKISNTDSISGRTANLNLYWKDTTSNINFVKITPEDIKSTELDPNTVYFVSNGNQSYIQISGAKYMGTTWSSIDQSSIPFISEWDLASDTNIPTAKLVRDTINKGVVYLTDTASISIDTSKPKPGIVYGSESILDISDSNTILGNTDRQLSLNSSDRPIVNVSVNAGVVEEKLAYESDVSNAVSSMKDYVNTQVSKAASSALKFTGYIYNGDVLPISNVPDGIFWYKSPDTILKTDSISGNLYIRSNGDWIEYSDVHTFEMLELWTNLNLNNQGQYFYGRDAEDNVIWKVLDLVAVGDNKSIENSTEGLKVKAIGLESDEYDFTPFSVSDGAIDYPNLVQLLMKKINTLQKQITWMSK